MAVASAAANRRNKKDFARIFYAIKQSAGPHLAVDRNCNGGFQLAPLEQLIAKTRKLPFKVFDHLPDIAAAYRNPLLAGGELTQQGWNNNDSHDGKVKKGRASRTDPILNQT